MNSKWQGIIHIWPRVLLFDLAHKQCNGIIKGWLHCLTPKSKGRFLVNNMLMFCSAWCLVMAQIQFSLIKKAKTGRPESSLTPHPLHPITYHFFLTPPPPLPLTHTHTHTHTCQSGHHMCITPNFKIMSDRKLNHFFSLNKISEMLL